MVQSLCWGSFKGSFLPSNIVFAYISGYCGIVQSLVREPLVFLHPWVSKLAPSTSLYGRFHKDASVIPRPALVWIVAGSS